MKITMFNYCSKIAMAIKILQNALMCWSLNETSFLSKSIRQSRGHQSMSLLQKLAFVEIVISSSSHKAILALS